MRWIAACVMAASAFAFASAGAACGGDSTTGDGGADAADATQGSDASGGSPDGCVPPDGGLACDPGHVACGTTSCNAATQFCCISDGGAVQTCTNDPPDSGKPPPAQCTTGSKAFCDEAADCPSGQVCCGFVGAGGGFSTNCATSCGNGLQFCRGSAECASGACTVQPCRGETIETCGSFCP